MAVEKHQRKTIKKAKKAELNAREDEIFADLDEVNQRDTQLKDIAARNITSYEDKKKAALDKIKFNEEQEKARENYKLSKGEDIFGDEDVQAVFKSKPSTAATSTYKEGEQIGQCSVEEIEDEHDEVDNEEPSIDDAPPAEMP